MAEDQFQAKLAEGTYGPLVRLAGTVNRSAQDEMDRVFDQALGVDGDIGLDFSDVTYINSTGIAIIVGVLARARAANRKVAAYGLTDHYREVFEITRLSDFIQIHQNAAPTV